MKPAFAVVGHPNKGKSSIVSTIARDDSLMISAESGTTKSVQALEVVVGDSQFTLYDTPGFQRPTKVLAWLQARASSADARAEAVRDFIASDQCRREFPDEVMLLEPIMAGAAILYVVDGSRPYGPEYEAEMEILRWTGQASMALINPIENEDYVPAWQKALGQYFKVVRVFNAMQADFEKLLSVLEAFSHIREEWRNQIEQLINAYKQERAEQFNKASILLAELLIRVCSCQVTQQVPGKSAAEKLKPVLEQKFLSEVSVAEKRSHRALRDLLRYENLEYSAADLSMPDDLFDTEKWIVWGLNRQQLTTAAIMAGAATGAAVDVVMAGSSLMLGAIGGGIIGAVGAWLGADTIADFRLQGLPVGGYEARYGPVRNRNFPYVIMARFLFLSDALLKRTHASRTAIEIQEGDLAARIDQLDPEQQRRLHAAVDRLSKQKPVEQLAETLKPLLTR